MKALKQLLLTIYAALLFSRPQHKTLRAFNAQAECEGPTITRYSTTAHTNDYILVKLGAAGYYDVCGAADVPIGICGDTVTSAQVGEARALYLLGLWDKVTPIRVSEAAVAGKLAYTDAAGEVQNDLPGSTGTYYMVGMFMTSQATAHGLAQLLPCFPQKVSVA